jgi:hypothetical protein
MKARLPVVMIPATSLAKSNTVAATSQSNPGTNRRFNRDLPQRGPLQPGEVQTDQRHEESMGKAISVPPQVPEVAEDGSAEQDEKNAESNRREQDGSMAQTGHCRTSGEARVICGLHRLRRINERVFQAPTSPNSTAAQFTDH